MAGEDAANPESASTPSEPSTKTRAFDPSKQKGKKPADKASADAGEPEGAAKAQAKPGKREATESSGKRRQRGRSMRGLSRRHSENLKKINKDRAYPIEEAVKLLKSVTGGTKFDQTINIVLNLGIDPKNADQMIRGSVSLPKGIGKTKRVIAFVDGDEAEQAKAAGAVEVGVDDLIKKVNDGWSDFDVAIAHPRTMGKVGRLGRVLGPQGKMPSPKNGTVTADIAMAVKDFAAGKIEFRNDAGGNIHAIVGKASFAEGDLADNIHSFIDHIRRMKPSSSKGQYLKKVCVSGTMSPGIMLEVAQ